MMSASSLVLTAFSQAALGPYKCPLVQSHTQEFQLEIKPAYHMLHNWPFAFAPSTPFNQLEPPAHLLQNKPSD